MTVPLIQRELALGAAALLAVVVALAVAARDDEAAVPVPASRLPQPAVSKLSGWYPALAGVRKRPLAGRPSGCGTLLDPKTLGVDHPVLPCGAKIFLLHDGEELLTEVIDNRLSSAQRQFELTPRLAAQLGVEGTQQLRWRFAVRDQGATR
jgi:hypothetical protein